MSEQLLNGLLGKVIANELPLAMASNKTEGSLQTNSGGESFSTKLADSVKNVSASNKQASTSVEPELTLSNQEDINYVTETASKGILTNIEGLQEQLNQVLSNNINGETFISSGINGTADSKTTPVSTQLHALLNGEETSTLAKAIQNGEEVSTLAKAMQNGEETSTLAKAMQNGEAVSTLAKAMQNGEETSTLAKAMQNGEAVSTLAKAMQNGEETSTLAKAMQNGEETSTLAKAMQNGEETSTLAKAMQNGEETSTLAKAMQNGEETSTLAKAMQNGEEVSTSPKAMLNSEEALSLAKPVRSGSEVSSLTKATKLKGKAISSTAKTMKDGEAISSLAKAEGSGEEISSLAKTMNDQGLQDNSNNRINGQLASRHADKSVPEESNPNLSPVQAEVEDSELHHALNVSKSQYTTTSSNNNDIIDNIKLDESANQSNVSQDNSFLNNQSSDTAKELNINLTTIKQGVAPKISFANVAGQINVAQPFESLGVDLVDNFIQRARLFTQGDKSAIKLQLNPPELGSLKLEFTVQDDVLEAKIFVERSVVKDIIEKDIPRLRELLANTEIDVGKLDVFLQEKEDERLGFMNKGFQSDPENDQAQESENQGNEDFGDEAGEELELSMAGSHQINYLV
jgi:flagellar hook-length control protein FliK